MEIFKCDLCGNNKFKTKNKLTWSLGIKENEKYRVLECQNCSLHTLHPIPTQEEFLKIYEKYAELGNRISVETHRSKTIYPKKLNLINKYNKKAKTILDIGAGNGGFINVALKNGFRATGIELEKSQVKLAKEKFGVDLINTTFEDYVKTLNSKFDVVHMHHVFEHVQKPSHILSLINDILEKDGIAIIEVPNQFFRFPNQLFFTLGLKKYRTPYNSYHHLYFYSKKTLLQYFSNNGYEILMVNDKIENNKGIKAKIKNVVANIFGLSTAHILEIVATKR